jgi:hypothetical protein
LNGLNPGDLTIRTARSRAIPSFRNCTILKVFPKSTFDHPSGFGAKEFKFMQQLLLLTLVALLVGIAIFAGLRTSQETMHQVNEYGVVQEAITIASYAQAWCLKPVNIGGGGGSFEEFTLAAINHKPNSVNGRFEISEVQAESFRLTGIGVEGSPLQVTLLVFPDSISGLKITR